MSYNSKELNQYLSEKRNRHQLLTTKVTSCSYDFNSHFPTSIEKVLGLHIIKIKQLALARIKNAGTQNKQMIMFANYSACLIQAHYKGYMQRKYYKMFLPILHRFKQLFRALILGWKTRTIMKSKTVKKKMSIMKEKISKNNIRQARILKRQLVEYINYTHTNCKWILILLEDRKYKQSLKKTNIINIFRQKTISQTATNNNSQQKVKINKKFPQKKQSEYHFIEEKVQQYMVQNQNQIPIKANGFYKIQGLQSEFAVEPHNKKKQNKQLKTRSKAKIQKTKTIKEKTNQRNQKNKALKNKNVQEKSQINKNQKKEYQLNIKPNEINNVNLSQEIKQQKPNISISQISIHLPIQQIGFEQEMNRKTMNIKFQQTIKLNNPIKLNEIMPPHQTKQVDNQKQTKNYKKGIRVTLNNIDEGSQSKNSGTHRLQNQTKEQSHDGLAQIIQVYNVQYTQKKVQIEKKMYTLKAHRKYI